jgi:peptidoglycan/LPS O-acetylase OafA/YrhL
MSGGRRLELDGVRGIAILLVVSYHGGFTSGGWLGVSLFFVLSGYLITGLLLDQQETTGRVDLPAFYRRRAVRLLPAVALALAALVAGLYLLAPDDVATGAAGAGWAIAYLANVAPLWTSTPLTGWMWSLSLEEQFYAIWPLALLLLLRRRTRSQAAMVVLGAAAAIAATRGIAVATGVTDAAYNTVRGDELLLGAALALAPVRLRWAGLPACLALAFFVTHGTLGGPMLALGLTAIGLSCAGLLSAATTGFARPVLSSAPLRFFGRISYALYLWNCLLGVLVLRGHDAPGYVAVWLIASVVAAYLSTRFVEEPLRRRVRVTAQAGPRVSVPAQSGAPTASPARA